MIDRMFDNLRPEFTIPKRTTEEELKKYWDFVLSDVNDIDLKRAVREHMLSSAKFWPKVGELREKAGIHTPVKAYGLLDKYMQWMREGQFGECPVCQEKSPWDSVHKCDTGEVVHDRAKHERQGIPVVGEAR